MIELKAEGLVKNYGPVKALRGVSFTAREGEIVGLLGPNGAGKTTTMRILASLLKPSEGRVLLNGREIWEDIYSYRNSIGYVPENAELYPHMSGYEYLVFVGRLRGMGQESKTRAKELLYLLGLGEKMHLPISSYSKGMKQKVLISSALLHNPQILLLDEPLSGLDSFTVLVMKALLKLLSREGKILLYASHILEVVEKICSRVIIINRGLILADEGVARLKELRHHESLEGVFKELVVEENPYRVAEEILGVLKGGET